MRGKKVWGPREDYRPILDKVLEKFPTLLEHVKPERIYLCGFIARRSKYLAKIRSNKHPWSLLLEDYDYCIEFHCTKFDKKSKYEQRTVMLHELVHIPKGGFQIGGPEYRKTLDHDVEDFSWMIKAYGIHLENANFVKKGEAGLFKLLGKES